MSNIINAVNVWMCAAVISFCDSVGTVALLSRYMSQLQAPIKEVILKDFREANVN